MGRPTKDYAGQRFGKLTAVRVVGRNDGRAIWECHCDCGNIVRRRSGQITGNLSRGTRASCGCGHIGTNVKHGMSKTKEHRAWLGMRKRCYDPEHHKYAIYGGRGIRVCDEWLDDFMAFHHHLGPAPSKQHSVDRIRVNGNYEPGNVRWATPVEQRHNRRR